MDLENMNITVGRLLATPKAKAIFAREFPALVKSPLIRLYQGKTLRQILLLADGKVPPDKIRRIIKELEEI